MDAGGAGGRALDRLLHHRAHAALVDVAHGEGADARLLDVLASPPGRRRAGRPPRPARRRPSARLAARPTSVVSPSPRATASGIPWMFPVGLVSGRVHVAVGVEPDEADLLLPRLRWYRDTPAIVPMAIEWSPPSTTGMLPRRARRPPCPAAPRRSPDLLQVLHASDRRGRGSPGSRRRCPRGPAPRSRARARGRGCSAARNADGPMSTPRRPAPRSRGTPMTVTLFLLVVISRPGGKLARPQKGGQTRDGGGNGRPSRRPRALRASAASM